MVEVVVVRCGGVGGDIVVMAVVVVVVGRSRIDVLRGEVFHRLCANVVVVRLCVCVLFLRRGKEKLTGRRREACAGWLAQG